MAQVDARGGAAFPDGPAAADRALLDPNDVRQTIWLTRPDLRALCGDDRMRFDWWLMLNGAREYRALAETEAGVSADLLTESAEEAFPGVRPVLTRFMRHVWTLRPDLHGVFDLTTPEGQEGYGWWFVIHGVAELDLLRFLTEAQKDFLNEPDPRFPDDGGPLPMTRLMVEVWQRRSDLQQAFALNSRDGAAGYLQWCYSQAPSDPHLGPLFRDLQIRLFRSPTAAVPRVPRILLMVWSGDGDVRARFPDPADPALRAWARDEGRSRFPILACLEEPAATPGRKAGVARRGPLPPGYNLIGYARGQFGIGEDVRMAALAMQAAGIPFRIHNVEPGREVCQGDSSAEALISDDLPYAVNLFCTTGIETARLAAVEGARLFDGRASIGYWPWELPEWPPAWHHAYRLVDEVWASSRYTYGAYAGSCDRPVRHMPMAVTVDAAEGLTRRDFGLPEGRFLFVFSFDGLSSYARKNPLACVRAFRDAFPRGDEPVGLVVKAMRASSDNPPWRRLLDEAEADDRIRIIARTLSRGAVLDLYRACDCFVSLHRAEGFGRGIAEAMMLERPVIVTGFSGNMDFCTPGTAALVDHRLRRVGTDDYPFGEGQVWAEPDASHAAWWMRRLAGDHELRTRLARQGRHLALATYAPGIVGAAYAAALRTAPWSG